MHLPFHGKQHQEFGSKHFECLATSGSCHASLLYTVISLLSSLNKNNIIWGAKKTSHGLDDAGKRITTPIISLPESPSFSKKLPSSPWVFNSQLQPYRHTHPPWYHLLQYLGRQRPPQGCQDGIQDFLPTRGSQSVWFRNIFGHGWHPNKKLERNKKKTTRDLGTWPSIKKPTYK